MQRNTIKRSLLIGYLLISTAVVLSLQAGIPETPSVQRSADVEYLLPPAEWMQEEGAQSVTLEEALIAPRGVPVGAQFQLSDGDDEDGDDQGEDEDSDEGGSPESSMGRPFGVEFQVSRTAPDPSRGG